jgi:hypothetical protein
MSVARLLAEKWPSRDICKTVWSFGARIDQVRGRAVQCQVHGSRRGGPPTDQGDRGTDFRSELGRAGTATSRRTHVAETETEAAANDHTGANSMTALRTTLSVMFLLLSMLLFGQGAASANQSVSFCKVKSLPPDMQNRLKEEYGSWKIQEPTDLSQRARERWESEKPQECPGIAVGHFESAKTPSYAILLVPRGHADGGYRFLVFSQKAGQPVYETRLVEKLDQNGAANYFIHRTSISKFFDEPSRKKFQAHTEDGILLVDSAENEYGVEVYFWPGGRYRHEPIDY